MKIIKKLPLLIMALGLTCAISAMESYYTRIKELNQLLFQTLSQRKFNEFEALLTSPRYTSTEVIHAVNLTIDSTQTHLLDEAAAICDIRYLENLVQHGANINAVSQDGRTPLHYACTFGNYLIKNVQFLVEHDARLNSRDHYGATPLDKATEFPRNAAEKVVNYLLAKKQEADSYDTDNSKVTQICEQTTMSHLGALLTSMTGRAFLMSSHKNCDPIQLGCLERQLTTIISFRQLIGYDFCGARDILKLQPYLFAQYQTIQPYIERALNALTEKPTEATKQAGIKEFGAFWGIPQSVDVLDDAYFLPIEPIKIDSKTLN